MINTSHKIIVINGASGGIGSAVAQKLAEQGYHLFLLGRSYEKLTALQQKIFNDTGNKEINILVITDFSKKSIVNTANKIISNNKKIYAYINCAGFVKHGGIFQASENDWHDIINLSLMSNIWFISTLAQEMITAKEGRIIFINGIFSIEPQPDFIVNSVVTGAIRNLSKALAKYLGEYNITVNCINPGATNTTLWENIVENLSGTHQISVEDINKNTITAIPLHRIAEPSDVSNCALYLCSDAAQYINGANITLDGGYTGSC